MSTSLERKVAGWIRARLAESHRCCDCQSQVSPWDDVCPHCGTASPARLRIAPAICLCLVGGCLATLVLLAG